MDGTHTTTTSVGPPGTGNTLSFSNPVYELSNPTAGESSIEALGQLPELPATPPAQEPTTPTTVAFKVQSHCYACQVCQLTKPNILGGTRYHATSLPAQQVG